MKRIQIAPGIEMTDIAMGESRRGYPDCEQSAFEVMDRYVELGGNTFDSRAPVQRRRGGPRAGQMDKKPRPARFADRRHQGQPSRPEKHVRIPPDAPGYRGGFGRVPGLHGPGVFRPAPAAPRRCAHPGGGDYAVAGRAGQGGQDTGGGRIQLDGRPHHRGQPVRAGKRPGTHPLLPAPFQPGADHPPPRPAILRMCR